MGYISNTVRTYLEQAILDMGFSKANAPSIMRPIFAGEVGQSSTSNSLLSDMESASKKQMEQMALKMSWVYSNVDTISKAVSSAQLYIVGATGAQETRPVTDHPFLKIFHRPNDFMSGSFLMRYTAMWLLLRGESYWMLVPDKKGDLSEIWPIPSDKIRPIPHPKKYIDGYLYKQGEQEQVLSVDDILYIREPNPFNYHRGMSKLTAARNAILTDMSAIDWNRDTFQNEATLRTLITVPQETPRNLFLQLKDELETQLIDRKKRYVISRGGDINAKSIGLSVKDMEYLQGREFSREEIDRIFGVPGGMWSKSANRANAENAAKIFAEMAVYPLLVQLSEEITSKLMPRYYPEQGVQAQFEDIRPEDREMALKERQLKYQSLTINEVRELQGRPPYESTYGDLPWPLRDKPDALRILFLDGTLDTVDLPTAEVPGENGGESSPVVDNTGAGSGDAMTVADGITGENRGIEPANNEIKSSKLNNPELQLAIDAERRALRNYCKNRVKAGDLDMSFEPNFISHSEVGAALDMSRLYNYGMDTPDAVKAISHSFEHGIGKAVTPTGDEELDPIVSEYYGDMEEAARMAAEGRMTESGARDTFVSVTVAALILALLRGREIDDQAALTPEEQQMIVEMRVILEASAANFATDLVNGRYSDDAEDNDALGGTNVAGLAFSGITAALANRLGIWANTISEFFWRGRRGRADSERKMQWLRGATVEPCATCVWLDGQIKTVEEWNQLPYYPQAKNGSLECGGWNCDCRFVDVD